MTLPRASSGSVAHRCVFSPCCRQEGRHLGRWSRSEKKARKITYGTQLKTVNYFTDFFQTVYGEILNHIAEAAFVPV